MESLFKLQQNPMGNLVEYPNPIENESLERFTYEMAKDRYARIVDLIRKYLNPDSHEFNYLSETFPEAGDDFISRLQRLVEHLYIQDNKDLAMKKGSKIIFLRNALRELVKSKCGVEAARQFKQYLDVLLEDLGDPYTYRVKTIMLDLGQIEAVYRLEYFEEILATFRFYQEKSNRSKTEYTVGEDFGPPPEGNMHYFKPLTLYQILLVIMRFTLSKFTVMPYLTDELKLEVYDMITGAESMYLDAIREAYQSSAVLLDHRLTDGEFLREPSHELQLELCKRWEIRTIDFFEHNDIDQFFALIEFTPSFRDKANLRTRLRLLGISQSDIKPQFPDYHLDSALFPILFNYYLEIKGLRNSGVVSASPQLDSLPKVVTKNLTAEQYIMIIKKLNQKGIYTVYDLIKTSNSEIDALFDIAGGGPIELKISQILHLVSLKRHLEEHLYLQE